MCSPIRTWMRSFASAESGRPKSHSASSGIKIACTRRRVSSPSARTFALPVWFIRSRSFMSASNLKQPETPEARAQWGKTAGSPEEQLFLEGPHGRGFELGRAIRIFRELIYGFRALHFVGPCITVFGSARFPAEHRYYPHPRVGSANCGRGLYGHDRRRTGLNGSRQSRGQGGRWRLHRL